ncbi:MAG: histidinol-phosphatase [Desulfamplus sp.]|nr:histidinol-phosphatase [Desulfamplus sp.]
MSHTKYSSVHGGHSGQFCSHAKDTLEEIILKYIDFGFDWVGITEHIYPISNELRYPDEIEANLDVGELKNRFTNYIKTCRELQEKYRDKITLFVAFETETYDGYKEFILDAIQTFKPDYVVGSVHHVDNICIDYSKEQYDMVADRVGGVDNLYCQYFDIQYEMLKAIKPAVVGHFDLIRIFDKDYPKRLKKPDIWQKILRNLELIKGQNLIMDFNLRALMKGAQEPYISAPILLEAKKMKIDVVTGDDSHGVCDIGVNMQNGVEILRAAGFDTNFVSPSIS